MQEPKINVTADKDGTLTILTGTAPAKPTPSRINIDCNLQSIKTFLKEKSEKYKGINTTAYFSDSKMYVEVITEEDFDSDREHGRVAGYTVKGKMTMNPDLVALGINKNSYTIDQLVSTFKMKRHYFPDKESHKAFLSNLTTFTAKIETHFKQSNDFKGNVASENIIKIKQSVKLDFVLRMKVFNGDYPKIDIPVNIEIIPSNGGLVYHLVSYDLIDYVETTVEAEFAAIDEVINSAGICKINLD